MVALVSALALVFILVLIFTCTYTNLWGDSGEATGKSPDTPGKRETRKTLRNSPGDEQLAHSAHLYHYQLKKKQLLEQEANQSFTDEEDKEHLMGGGNVDSAGRVSSGDRSDGGASLSSDRGGGSASGRSSRNSTLRSSSGPRESVALVSTSAHDSSDVATVYECTGLATSNDLEEMVVRNPVFQHDISNETLEDDDEDDDDEDVQVPSNLSNDRTRMNGEHRPSQEQYPYPQQNPRTSSAEQRSLRSAGRR
ncbi:uncharacterized protein LOC134839014 isoform X3 [Symsagittifera roscoffensis]|uniref:uncharacterized protein LOC134839014 isoform X3 n=1 Tax=Symsagittifera roscoffensis TaxID=84072 RepID=UPI00307B2CBE